MAQEIEIEDALLMKANKPETALTRAPTFSPLLVSHGGISSCMCVQEEYDMTQALCIAHSLLYMREN